jgi:hypothetical protein
MEKRYFSAILFASILVLALVPSVLALDLSVAAPDSLSSSKAAADYVCSGSNDRAQIASALAAVSASGGGTVHLSEGTFRIAYLNLPGNVALEGKGPSSTKVVFTASGNMYVSSPNTDLAGFTITGPGVVWIVTSHVTVRDVTIRSNGLRWAAFSVEKNSASAQVGDIEFNNCQAIDCDTNGFCVSGGSTSYVITDLRFIDCRAVNCGRASPRYNPYVVGFDLAETVSVDGLLVDGCYAAGNWESGFHFEGRPTVRNGVFRDCLSENNGQCPTAQWGAGYLVGEGTIVENCRSVNNQYGYYVHGAALIRQSTDIGADTSFILGYRLSGAQLIDVGSKNAKVTALTAADNTNLVVRNLVVENCLGSTPVLAPRPVNSVIDWSYGSIASIGTSAPAPTATPVPTRTVTSSAAGSPYPSAHAVPGRVEAEDYNVGGFSDTTAANEGGAYRNDAVDIEVGGANYNVGWIRAGEYLEYSVDAASAGTYTATFRVANAGAAKTVTVYVNGVPKTLTIPATGSFATWQNSALSGIGLKAGRNLVRIEMGSASSFNLDRMDFATAVASQPTVSTTSASSQTASIKFTSLPAGGSIYLDGAYRGLTPATIPGIALGTHRAEIRYSGYQSWVKSITVTQDFLSRVCSYNPTLVPV